jgi:hypothetical protein
LRIDADIECRAIQENKPLPATPLKSGGLQKQGKAMSTVKVVMSGHGKGRVFVDGHELNDVLAIRFATEARGTNLLILELSPQQVQIEGPIDVTIEGEQPKQAAA